MKKLIGAAMLATLFGTTPANAATNVGYVGISGDLMWPQNSDFDNGKTKYDLSGGGNVSIGYKGISNIRAELEGGYHWLNLNKVTVGSTGGDTSGNLGVATVMANLYYDLPTYSYSGFTPYIGAGLGDAFLNLPKDTALGSANHTDNEFAYQAMIGVSYTPKSTPMTDWSLGYHYLGVYRPELSNVTFDSLNTHSVEVGLRQHF